MTTRLNIRDVTAAPEAPATGAVPDDVLDLSASAPATAEEDPGEFVRYDEPQPVETLVVMMTEAEARLHVKQINDLVGSIGKLLVDLKKREGWKALGYHSWTECLNQEFDESRSYLYRLMAGEAVRKDLLPIGDIEASQIPESQLRELADVPSEHRVEVYKEAKATAPDGKVTAKHIQEVKATVIKPPKPKPPKKTIYSGGSTWRPEGSPNGSGMGLFLTFQKPGRMSMPKWDKTREFATVAEMKAEIARLNAEEAFKEVAVIKPKKPKKAAVAPEIPADDPYNLADDDDRFDKIFEQVDDTYNEFFPQIISRLKERTRSCDWGLTLAIIVEEQWNIKALESVWQEFQEFNEKRKTALKKYNSLLRKAQ